MSRISSLPRRDWRQLAEPFVEALTNILKTSGGQQRLRLGQTGALLELALTGLVEQGRVGIGKSLVLALAPTVLGSTRPLIMTTGGLRQETWDHIQAMRRDWQIVPDLQILSYTALSNYPRQGKTLRDLWPEGPNYIGCDEIQNLANVRGAAVAKQVHDWTVEEPECVIVGASGSLDLEGLPSFAHIFDWSLRDKSPMPRTPHEVATWSQVIDEDEPAGSVAVCADLDIPRNSTPEQIRAAFRERIWSAPGVIVDDTPFTGVPLTVKEHLLDVKHEAEYEQLRELGQRPDGTDVLVDDLLVDTLPEDSATPAEPDRVAGGRVAETARQFGSDFYYKMWPPAPPEWLKKRSKYFKHVRARIGDGLFLTEAQVRAEAIEHDRKVWTEWEAIRPSFVPQYQTVWLGDTLAEWLEAWGKEGPGIVWTEHVCLGPHLHEKLGWQYFGGKGRGLDRTKITDGPRPSPVPILASRRANGTGRNLQFQWNRCCFIQPVGRSYIFEQTSGRIHREGQEQPCTVDILMRCTEDFRAREQVLAGAKRTSEKFYSQKACAVPWEKVTRPSTGWAFK